MTYTPTVRKPTGIPAAPLIMISGAAKAGKSMTAYKLGADPRIANCWVIDLGEGSADEYADLGTYTVLEWGRTWADLADTIRWAVAQPVAPGMLNAVIVDSGTEMWDGLKARADHRARNSKKNRDALAKDPDHEVDIAMAFWTDAKETWARIVSPLRLAAHIVGVILVRSDEVAEVVNGVPTNRKVISYKAENSLPATVTAHIQIRPDHTAWLTEVRSMHITVPKTGLQLKTANPVSELVTLMTPPDGTFGPSTVTTPSDDARISPPISEEQAATITALMNSVDDEDVRKGLKKAYVTQFGPPASTTLEQLDTALQWVHNRLARLQPEPDQQENPAA